MGKRRLSRLSGSGRDNEAKEDCIYGSSNSWLLIFDHTRSNKLQHGMKILNIFSRTQIDLPAMSAPPSKRYDCDWKLLLLSNSCPLSSDFILFLLQHSVKFYCSILSSWKPGQTTWSAISKFDYGRIQDAILYKGKLYVTVSDRNGEDTNFLITYNYELKVEAKISIPDLWKDFLGLCFVVKSYNDNCLLVGNTNEIFFRYSEKPVEILEFDVCSKEWRKLEDLGGFALVLGKSRFLAKAAGNVETWFKANCIYVFGIRDIIVYDLENKRRAVVPLIDGLGKDMDVPLSCWVSLDV